MGQVWSVPAWALLSIAVAVVLVVTLAAVVARRSALAARAETERARVESAALTQRIAALEEALDPPATRTVDAGSDDHEYVITRLGDDHPEPSGPQTTLPGPVFAELLARESAVRLGGLAAGLRRALAPETRNRIRFEMRREVKRARKQRRADLKQARREFEDRQRARVDLESDAA